MKRCVPLAIAVSLLASCTPTLPRREPPRAIDEENAIALENDFVAITFDRAKKGNLVQYRDKTSNRDFLAPNMDKAFLYQFIALDAKGKREYFFNTQAKESSISFHRNALTIRNSCHRDKPITVTVTCTISADSPLTRWRIAIDNKSDLKIR